MSSGSTRARAATHRSAAQRPPRQSATDDRLPTLDCRREILDEETGAITIDHTDDAVNYGVVDEIADASG